MAVVGVEGAVSLPFFKRSLHSSQNHFAAGKEMLVCKFI